MLQRIGFVFLIFFIIVLANAAFASLGHVFASPPAIFSSGTSTGLKSVDFGDFGSGGPGWKAITQGYGRTAYAAWYVGGWHNGIDIAAAYGAPILSPATGEVLAIGNQDNYCPSRGFGRYVALLDPKNNLVLWFAHLGSINVSARENVVKGTEVGTIGNSGFETGAHLHFSIFEAQGFSMKPKNGCGPDADGKDVNPVPYLGTTYK